MSDADNSVAVNYFRTAQEHPNMALQLWQDEDYAARDYWVHYLSGLAVECILRAYIRRRTDKFDSRHDLYQLAKEAEFFLLVGPEQQEEYGAYFSTISVRWRSNHRYSTVREVKQRLYAMGAEKRSRGDLLHNSSRTLLNLAITIVNLREAKWQTRP